MIEWIAEQELRGRIRRSETMRSAEQESRSNARNAVLRQTRPALERAPDKKATPAAIRDDDGSDEAAHNAMKATRNHRTNTTEKH
jgi:hypothetical protein